MQIYIFFARLANDKQQNRLSVNHYCDTQAI